MTARTPPAAGLALLLLTGCYLSAGRSHVMPADGSSTEDAAREDAPLDVAPDEGPGEPDVETDDGEEDMPEPACLLRFSGVRRLFDDGHETVAPDLHWNGGEVGVALMESGGDTGHSFVSLVNVLPDLTAQGSLQMIGEESHGWGETAWTGDALGLCWHSDPGFVGRTGFRLHDRNGAALIERVDLDLEGEACLDLAFGGGRFLAAWRHVEQVGTEFMVDPRLQVLDSGGLPVGETLSLERSLYPGFRPSIAHDGEQFVVAMAAGDRIDLSWLSPDGEITRTESLPMAASFTDAAVGDGGIALAWLSGEQGLRGLTLSFLDQDFQITSTLVVSPEGTGAGHPDLIPVDDGFFLAWYQGPDDDPAAMLLHVDPTGFPREPRIVMHEGPNSGYGGPALLSAGSSLYAGVSYPPPDSSYFEQVHLLWFDCVPGERDVCAPQVAALPVVCPDPVSLGWKWDGSACVELVGCAADCEGEDCGRLARTDWECAADRRFCM